MLVRSSFIALTALALSSATANAAVSVFGGGYAADCYKAAETSNLPAGKAIEVCNLAIEQENLSRKNRAATYVNRGIIYMREGQNERALADYDSGLRLLPDLYEAHVNRGAALHAMQRFQEALDSLNIGVKSQDPNALAVGYYNRGLVNERLGDVTNAYLDFKKALETRPEFGLAARQLERFTVVEQ